MPSPHPRKDSLKGAWPLIRSHSPTDMDHPEMIGNQDKAPFAWLHHFSYASSHMDGFQERKWFVYQTDHHEGPFSLAEIQQKMSSGEVQRTQYVWCDGMSDWQMMTAVREFDALTTPPLAPEAAPLPSFAEGSFSKDTLDFELNPAPALENSVSLEIQPTPAQAPAQEPESTRVELQPITQTDTSVALTLEDPAPEVSSTASEPEPKAPLLDAKVELNPDPVPVVRDLGEGFESVSSEPPRSFGFLKVFLTLSIVGIGAYGYNAGHLDPVVKNPTFVKFVAASRAIIQPGLSKLAQWIPPLQGIFSPIPDIEGVSPEELSEMRTAASSKTPGQLGLSLYRDDLLAPTFYVGTNLPNGTSLDITVVGVPDSLLSQTHSITASQGVVDQFVARVESVRQKDGRPLVQGQYFVVVTESDSAKQSPEASAALESLPNSTLLPPADSGITGPKKLVLVKSYFLGGTKDDTYSQRLKEFHEKLTAKSKDELSILKQYRDTLEIQLKDSSKEYEKAKSNKNAKLAAKAWNSFHEKWRRMQSQLEEAFSKFNEALARDEFFHSQLFQQTRTAGDQVSQLHAAQHALMTNRPKDMAAADAEIAPKQKAAQESMDLLKSKLEETEKLTPTSNGMPQRLVAPAAPVATAPDEAVPPQETPST